jgi:membrane-associated protein
MLDLLHTLATVDLAEASRAASDQAPAAKSLVGSLLSMDESLMHVIKQSQGWAYLIMFGIIFAETGFVIFPFLPGDSFLFALGVLSADNDSGIRWYFVIPLLIAAAILGNTTNYALGWWLGPRIFRKQGGGSLLRRALSRDKLDSARAFFNRHGGKAITFAQFVPFMRCFVPFVAGLGRMDLARFLFFNWLGALLWISSFVASGYAFGHIPGIKRYTSEIFLGLILIIVVVIATPPLLYLSKRRAPKVSSAREEPTLFHDPTSTRSP